ncbi:hypothetical protein Tco_1001723 [Tanacetum coccineum]
MFESGSYKSHPEHVALYETLEASMKHAQRDEFLAEKAKPRKRLGDDQDPHSPPPKDSDQSKRKRHDSDASGLKQPPVPQSLAWTTSDTREAPSNSSKQKFRGHRYCTSSLDQDQSRLIQTYTYEEIPKSPKPVWAIPLNELPEAENNYADALAKSDKDLEENKLLSKTRDMGSFIKWYCKRIRKKKLTKADLEGPAYMTVKPFHTNNISFQF